ncbi:unnamed protein product [Gongylonema pulchrum]|uniref:KAD8 kinase n=1 Tax=Gongylonema pulchrum TaxID=637853 RepID=A0A183D110_9BILA|nr:unnamed protein product [Gongylonema pulchrum]
MARRSLRQDAQSKLIRLRSAVGNDYLDASSCPDSPCPKKTCRLVVVGAPRTGKSAIVKRFLCDKFEERYIPTIEEFYRKQYKIRGEIYQLEIVDCSGNDPFPAARKLCYLSVWHI